MIKNVLLDMGGVLIEWDPALFLRRLGLNIQEDIDIVLDHTVRQNQWHEYDMGFINKKELLHRCLKNTPKYLQKVTKKFVLEWHNISKAIEGMPEYTHYLQEKGYKVYVLSNAGKNQPYYIRRFPYAHLDGSCISAFYGVGKPQKEFYETILRKFNLKAEECVFADDLKKNVEGAKKLGIKAYLFKNTEKLKKDLKL